VVGRRGGRGCPSHEEPNELPEPTNKKEQHSASVHGKGGSPHSHCARISGSVDRKCAQNAPEGVETQVGESLPVTRSRFILRPSVKKKTAGQGGKEEQKRV